MTRDVNPAEIKQLTNFRAAGKDEPCALTPHRQMTLEQAVAYIDTDELCRSDAEIDLPAQAPASCCI